MRSTSARRFSSQRGQKSPNRVVALAREVDELGFGRVVGLRQRIDLEVGLDVLHRRLEALGDGAAQEHEVAVCAGFDDKIAIRHGTLVVRRQHQVFSTFAFVRPYHAKILDKSEPGVVDEAEHAGRQFDRRNTTPSAWVTT